MAKNDNTPSQPDRPNPSDLTYEQAIERLEEIINQIEEGTVGLEDSITSYRYGTELIKRCKTILETAEQEIIELDSKQSKAE